MAAPELKCPVSGILFEPVTWTALLAGSRAWAVPDPHTVTREQEVHPQARVEFVPSSDLTPEATWGRLVPLFTRVRLQVMFGPGGTWKTYFPAVKSAGQPGGWLVVKEGAWRFYVERAE